MKGKPLAILISFGVLLFVPSLEVQFFAKVVLAIFVFSWFVAARPRDKFTLEPEFKMYRLFAYERQTIKLQARNHSRLPIEVLAISDKPGPLHTPGGTSIVCALNGLSRVDLDYTIWYEHRGLYKLGPTEVVGSDPLGLFPWFRSFENSRTAIVYPRIVPADVQLARGMLGTISRSTWIEHTDRMETKAVRPWLEGDEFRSIHWKQTARTGRIMVKESPMQQDIEVLVLLNLRLSDFPLKQKYTQIERCIEAATAILVEINRQGMLAQFSTIGQMIDPEDIEKPIPIVPGACLPIDHGPASLTMALEYLALTKELHEECSLVDVLAALPVHNRPFFIMISPHLTATDLESLVQFVPSVRHPRLVMLKSHSNEPGADTISSANTLAGIELWDLPLHGENAGVPHG